MKKISSQSMFVISFKTRISHDSLGEYFSYTQRGLIFKFFHSLFGYSDWDYTCRTSTELSVIKVQRYPKSAD